MRTLDVPEYTPSRTRCNSPFLGFLRSFSLKNTCVMHQFRLSPSTTRSHYIALDPCGARRPSTPLSPDAPWCICYQHARRVAQRRLQTHRSPLKPPPRFTLSPLFTMTSFFVSSTLLQERYKNNETTKENPLHYLTLSLALCGRRWVLASLSILRARVDFRPQCPDT